MEVFFYCKSPLKNNFTLELLRTITIQTVNSIAVKFRKISLAHRSKRFYICIQKLIDVQQTLIIPNVRDPNPKKILYSFNPGKTIKIRSQSTSFFFVFILWKKYYPKKNWLLKKRTINPEIPNPTRLKSLKKLPLRKKWKFFLF